MAILTEDRILDFLDGRLTSGDEEELLHSLAVSPERRGVLRGHMRLRELTNNLASAERFSVPKHVTSQLFRSLHTMGLSATASTEEILSNAPQLAKMAAAEKGVSSIIASSTIAASSLAGSGIASGIAASGWQVSFASIVGASLLSFALGAGAYHVFAHGVGLHPFGDTKSVQIAQQQATTSILHESSVNSPSPSPVQNAESHRTAGAPLSLTTNDIASIGALPHSTPKIEPPFDGGPAIGFAAPIEAKIIPQAIEEPTTLASQHLLARAIESPLENPKGTISLRYGAGVIPTNTITTWSSLEELRFRWTLLNYIVGSASLGQLQSYVHQAMQPDRTSSSKINQITVGEVASNTLLIGAEAGITLDPIHLPFEATVGYMTDGAENSYYRCGLFAHYEPFEAMSIVAGFEGVWYTNNIGNSVKQEQNIYSSLLAPHYTIKGPTGTETAGFFGPSIEFGWHF